MGVEGLPFPEIVRDLVYPRLESKPPHGPIYKSSHHPKFQKTIRYYLKKLIVKV